MANTDFNAVLTAVPVVRSSLLTAMEKRGIYVVSDAESPTALTPGNVLYLAFGGRIFRYDSTDSTTANDGVTCCVTADGKRFKADNYAGSQKRIWEVKSKTLTAPPGSPTIGDQYIVAASATGAWAGKDNEIEVYTARGWVPIVPSPYDIALNDADTSCYYYNLGGTWSSGFPFTQVADGSLSLKKLKYFPLGVSIINQTTNAPPGSPSDGDAYVIGPTPSGAWTGLARQVAIYEVSAWQYYVPYDGASVFDKNNGGEIIYRTGTATWTNNSSYAQINTGAAPSGSSGNVAHPGGGGGIYTYSPTTAPVTSKTAAIPGGSISHTTKKASAVLEVEIMIGDLECPSVADDLSIGLFVDAAVTATDWMHVGNTAANEITNIGFKFIITGPADTAAHTYTLRYGGSTSAGTQNSIFSRVRMMIRELS